MEISRRVYIVHDIVGFTYMQWQMDSLLVKNNNRRGNVAIKQGSVSSVTSKSESTLEIRAYSLAAKMLNHIAYI